MDNLKISGILHQSIFMLYCQVLQRLQKIYFSNQSFFRHSLTFIWMDDESVTFFFLSPRIQTSSKVRNKLEVLVSKCLHANFGLANKSTASSSNYLLQV